MLANMVRDLGLSFKEMNDDYRSQKKQFLIARKRGYEYGTPGFRAVVKESSVGRRLVQRRKRKEQQRKSLPE